ncbi:MAG: caspase family protein [Burkholderiales bacterium]|nr:caspase family protein [Burkholderiales bacterium]
MTTRRRFLQTLAAIPPSLLVSPSWSVPATADSSRLALVFGNSAYRDAPLTNPGNDARAMSSLLNQAGFTVDSHLDATRTGMIAAIEKFGAAIQRPETKQVVFYYAGHGVQLDWRNYLLPVDAVVEKTDQLKQRCVDLGLLLGQLGKAKDKTFIIILDACRNNPFGRVYKPQRKGLSQFDAPVGSLLAYATAPGNVASDGSGKNGLYTENLVRELSQRNTRIEDALKRVRLNVRLSSSSEQIPWETTSLESDVYLFNEGQKKLSDDELEKLIEADISEWNRIKSSRNIEDWVAYLRKFPNGRFAEIGQVRLARLLEDKTKTVSTTATSSPPKPIELAAGTPIPELFRPSDNPYSAGYYPLGRKFTMGDKAYFKQTDILSGAETRSYMLNVTRVNLEADRIEFNLGVVVTDLMGNMVKWGKKIFEAPIQFSPSDLQVGKKWTAAYSLNINNRISNGYYDLHIVRKEKVTVPAGEFEAFRVEGRGWNKSYGSQLETTYWLVPGLNFEVKREYISRKSDGNYIDAERHELVALWQAAVGT